MMNVVDTVAFLVLHAVHEPVMTSLRWCCYVTLLAMASALSAPAQESKPAESAGPREFNVVIGIRIQGAGASGPVTAATPIPIEWPEQRVTLVSKEISKCKDRVRNAGQSGAMLLIDTQPLRAGEEASAIYHYRITVHNEQTIFSAADFPARRPKPARDLALFLKAGPGIQATDAKVRKLAGELSEGRDSDWEKVEAFHDWALTKIDYREMGFTSAKEALGSGIGDCEEKSAILIALCRASGIPARTVLTPGHAWAEFHLIDNDGVGRWIAADATIPGELGRINQRTIILQKGDNIRLPERKGPATRLMGSWSRSLTPLPKVEFIQQVEPAE